MAAVSVRGLDDEVKERLQVRAAEHGRSLEAEIRSVLEESVREPDEHHLGRGILDAFHGDGVELDLPDRSFPARSAELS